MPEINNDDIVRRFRQYHRPATPQNRLITDFQAGARPVRPARPGPLPAAAGPTRVPPLQSRRPQPVAPPAAAVPVQALRPSIEPPLTLQTPPPAKRQPLPTVKHPRRRRIRRIVLTILLLLILSGGGWFGYKVLSNLQHIFKGSIFNVLTTTKLNGEDTGRVNFLLAGNSADDPGHDGADLTDSIMVVSLDVQHKTAFMLSVPRDMWVEIPGYGHAKINEAYVDGESGGFSAAGYPNGGMGLLAEVINQNFGIKANYYGLVGYNALRDGVNAVGGVDITIASADSRGLYDPSVDWTTHGPLVKLTNGVHHLNGEQALDLARARGDAYGSYGFPRSDFDRTEHQRQLILALKEKVLSAGTLANPIALGNLFDSLGSNIKTDMSLSEVRRLYDLGKDIKSNDIQSVGLNDADGKDLLANYTSPTGQSTLIPAAGIDNFTAIEQYIARLSTNNPVVRENAKVVVLNGTNTLGLAAQAQKQLTNKLVNVVAIGDAGAVTPTSVIIDATGKSSTKPATLVLLKNLFHAGTSTTTNPYASMYDADFIVVLGTNWVTADVTTPTP